MRTSAHSSPAVVRDQVAIAELSLELAAAYGQGDEYYDRLERELLEHVRHVADWHGHKVLAGMMGRSRAHLDKSLSGSDRHRLTLRDLLVAIAVAPNQDIVAMLAAIGAPAATPEEELAAFKSAAAEYLGPEARKGLLAKARAKLVRERMRGAK